MRHQSFQESLKGTATKQLLCLIKNDFFHSFKQCFNSLSSYRVGREKSFRVVPTLSKENNCFFIVAAVLSIQKFPNRLTSRLYSRMPRIDFFLPSAYNPGLAQCFTGNNGLFQIMRIFVWQGFTMHANLSQNAYNLSFPFFPVQSMIYKTKAGIFIYLQTKRVCRKCQLTNQSRVEKVKWSIMHWTIRQNIWKLLEQDIRFLLVGCRAGWLQLILYEKG